MPPKPPKRGVKSDTAKMEFLESNFESLQSGLPMDHINTLISGVSCPNLSIFTQNPNSLHNIGYTPCTKNWLAWFSEFFTHGQLTLDMRLSIWSIGSPNWKAIKIAIARGSSYLWYLIHFLLFGVQGAWMTFKKTEIKKT